MVNENKLENEIRYEKKWVYKNYHFFQLLNKLKRSELKFKIHHKSRLVNSIYFDDNNLSNIKDNLEGEKKRIKYRVRWYGSEKYIFKPFLEIKYKDALKTRKIRDIIKLDKELKSDPKYKRRTARYTYTKYNESEEIKKKKGLKKL